MQLIVGLGNHGKKYEKNRHNVGFMAVDLIAENYDFPPFKEKFKGLVSKGEINGQEVILLKPQTYMNLSGESVQPAAAFYKITPDNITVIHDDIDLPLGKVKIKIGGGNAGHNGLKSIDQKIGSNYRRIRIGVGRPQYDVSSYVLSDFAKEEILTVNDIVQDTIKDLPQLFE
jgi:PTH1 family peptidyl-tRNA hydrolase